jgi:hypothetical protein
VELAVQNGDVGVVPGAEAGRLAEDHPEFLVERLGGIKPISERAWSGRGGPGFGDPAGFVGASAVWAVLLNSETSKTPVSAGDSADAAFNEVVSTTTPREAGK